MGDYTGTTVDQGYCFGATPNTYTSDAHSGLPDAAPFLWGNDKGCDWEAGDDIRVSIHVTAQHKGTHFVDFVPQNEAQLEGLPLCPGSKDANGNVAPFKRDRINDFEVCVHDHVHYADGNGQRIPDWQRKSIRLHPAFALVDERDATSHPEFQMKFYSSSGMGPATSTSNYRIDYRFKLPNLNYDASKPAIFRWVWFCGYDAQCDCTPANGSWMYPNVTSGDTCPSNSYVGYGLGEIFVNCADITRVTGGSAPGPNPTTQAPTTEAVTTQAPTTTRPIITRPPITTRPPVTTQAPITTEEPHPCPTTSAPETDIPRPTTEAPETTIAPETTSAPETTPAPESGVCRRNEISQYPTGDDWCAANCSPSMPTMCCSGDQSTCTSYHHCFCPGESVLLI